MCGVQDMAEVISEHVYGLQWNSKQVNKPEKVLRKERH